MSGRVNGEIRLLPRERWIKTSEIDCPTWTESGVLGFILRRRFRLLVNLLGNLRYPRLLDIGYGGGMLMPELARHCDELLGVDIHPHAREVEDVLAGEGVRARLCRASGADLPYATESIDAIVAMSSLEFIDPFDRAAREFRRVLKPGGVFVMVTPGDSPLLDLGLKLLTGRSADNDFGERRRRIIPTLMREFTVDARRSFPPVRPFPIHVYHAFRFRKAQ